MRRNLAGFVALSLPIAVASAAGAELPPLVDAAFARAAGSPVGWSYTRNSVENGNASVERFDPAVGDGAWTLIEVGGKAPSNRQLKKYAANGDRRKTRDHPGAVDFREIVDVDSVTPISETATVATYRFKPAPDEDDDEDPSAFLEGTMVIDKSRTFVRSLELTSTEPFSPATGIKINEMRVTMTFTLVDDGAGVAMRELSKSVEGRLFGIKRISDTSTVTFSRSGRQD